jgi:hypothetical protein
LKSFVIGHLPFFICHFGALSLLAFSDVLFFKRARSSLGAQASRLPTLQIRSFNALKAMLVTLAGGTPALRLKSMLVVSMAPPKAIEQKPKCKMANDQ